MLRRSFARLDTAGLELVGGLAVLGLSAWAFGWIVEELAEGDTAHLDTGLAEWLHGRATPGLTELFEAVTVLGNGPLLVAVAALGAVYAAWRRALGPLLHVRRACHGSKDARDGPRRISRCSLPPVDRPTAVLIDARNVLRSRWPNIPEEQLVAACRTWAEVEGVEAVVVFDRAAPGGVVGEQPLDERCVLVGTGRESADEWIERAAAQHEREGRPYWLVTSDRALRAAAGRAAERTIGGGSFAGELV